MDINEMKKIKNDAELVNALDLSDFKDETFDIVLLFAPRYHLHEEKSGLSLVGWYE